MGRNRSSHPELPHRVHQRSRSYYYVFRGDWFPLGQNQNHAFHVAEQLNSLDKGKRSEALGDMSNLSRLSFEQATEDVMLAKQSIWSAPYQKYACVYCGATAEEMDHFLPRSKGGTDQPSNMVASCASCNAKKKARHPIEFLAELTRAGLWPPDFIGNN